jgi:hypothetical protein
LSAVRLAAAALALALLQAPSGGAGNTGGGPFDIPLFATKTAPAAQGHARLVYAASPFGVAVTADGRARYDVQITVSGLSAPAEAGAHPAYVAWAVTPDLGEWHRLGAIANGRTTVGEIAYNKFLLVITAERSAEPATHAGPVVMRGYAPSIWLQTFLTHPLFRGVY